MVRPTKGRTRFAERPSDLVESEYGRDGKRGERDLDADTVGVGILRTRQFEEIARSDLVEAVALPPSTHTARRLLVPFQLILPNEMKVKLLLE
jgi:hypothetical protein